MELDVLEALSEVGLPAACLDEIMREPLADASEILEQGTSFSDQSGPSETPSGRRSVPLCRVFEEASHFIPRPPGQGHSLGDAKAADRANAEIPLEHSSGRGLAWSADVPIFSVVSGALAALNGDDLQETDLTSPGVPSLLTAGNPEMPGPSWQYRRYSGPSISVDNAGDAPQDVPNNGQGRDEGPSSPDPRNAVADKTLGAPLPRDIAGDHLAEVQWAARIEREILANPQADGEMIAASLARENVQVSPSSIAFVRQKLRRERVEAIILANPTEGRPSIARRLQQEGIHLSDGGLGKIMRKVREARPDSFPARPTARPTGVRLSQAEKDQLREVIRANPDKTMKAIGELLARRHVYVGRDVIWRTLREEKRINAGLPPQEKKSGEQSDFGY